MSGQVKRVNVCICWYNTQPTYLSGQVNGGKVCIC